MSQPANCSSFSVALLVGKNIVSIKQPEKRRPVFSWGRLTAVNAADASCLCFWGHQVEQLPSSANAQAGREAYRLLRTAVCSPDR